MDVKKEFERQKARDAELVDEANYSPGRMGKKFGYYGKTEFIRDKAKWEISCALITRDWKRVRNALLILSGGVKREQTESQ